MSARDSFPQPTEEPRTDLTFSERETAFRDELRAWFAANDPGPEPVHQEDLHFAWRRDFQRRLHEGGWAAPHWPREYGAGQRARRAGDRARRRRRAARALAPRAGVRRADRRARRRARPDRRFRAGAAIRGLRARVRGGRRGGRRGDRLGDPGPRRDRLHVGGRRALALQARAAGRGDARQVRPRDARRRMIRRHGDAGARTRTVPRR